VGNLPLSQFYHVSADMEWPYNVYGGLQDNATWYGPSRRGGPIGNKHWNAIVPGDGFWAFPDPTDFVSIKATDGRRATVVTIDGRTMRTDDQGATWIRLNP